MDPVTWVIIMGLCTNAGWCVPDDAQNINHSTFTSEYNCEVAGFLLDYIGNQRVPRTHRVVHKCYNLDDYIDRNRAIKEKSEKRKK